RAAVGDVVDFNSDVVRVQHAHIDPAKKTLERRRKLADWNVHLQRQNPVPRVRIYDAYEVAIERVARRELTSPLDVVLQPLRYEQKLVVVRTVEVFRVGPLSRILDQLRELAGRELEDHHVPVVAKHVARRNVYLERPLSNPDEIVEYGRRRRTLASCVTRVAPARTGTCDDENLLIGLKSVLEHRVYVGEAEPRA